MWPHIIRELATRLFGVIKNSKFWAKNKLLICKIGIADPFIVRLSSLPTGVTVFVKEQYGTQQ
jgi:hypothetical protein